MHKEKTWLTCKEAAALLNCTQRSILNYIKNGKFSAERDINDNWIIQKAEFFRVYPETMTPEKDRNAKKNAEKEATKFLEEKIKYLQQMIEEKNKHNDFLMSQLNIFTEEKSKMLDAINSHARLLEYKESIPKSGENNEDKQGGWWPFKKA